MNSEAKLKRPQFLNVKELADMLRTKLRTIYDWVSQGRIPCRKAGIERSSFWIRFRMNKQPRRRGATCALLLNCTLLDVLSRPQVKARRLKSATTKVYHIEINWQEVNHEQANKRAA